MQRIKAYWGVSLRVALYTVYDVTLSADVGSGDWWLQYYAILAFLSASYMRVFSCTYICPSVHHTIKNLTIFIVLIFEDINKFEPFLTSRKIIN